VGVFYVYMYGCVCVFGMVVHFVNTCTRQCVVARQRNQRGVKCICTHTCVCAQIVGAFYVYMYVCVCVQNGGAHYDSCTRQCAVT